MKGKTLALISALLLAAGGCGAEDGDDEEILATYCNPISSDHCLLPWPSTFYLKQDPATQTGYRVDYPVEAMPTTHEDVPLSPTRYNFQDGFSIGSQILVFFASGVAGDGLPRIGDLAGSVTAKSLIWLLEFKSGERVPLFAELDANALGNEIPGLIIRPQVPLEFNARYVVLLRSGLKDRQGAPLQPPDPFRRLRDGLATKNETLLTEKARMAEVLAFLDQQGVPREEMVLAWDFHTASQQSVTGNVVGMVDEALSKLPATGPAFSSITTLDYDPDKEPDLLREIEAEMEVPSYLESDDPDSWLKLDAEGKPVYRAMQKFPFLVHIPRCAETATGPLPVMIFGHGLMGSPRREMLTDYQKMLHNRLCMVQASTHWRGLSEVDVASIVMTVMMDFSNLPRITDQLQQAHVNAQVLAKLMQGPFLQDPALQVGGKPVADGKEIYYLGISNGGIQGVTFAALSPDIERFVFNVSAGWWSFLLQRSSSFLVYALTMERVYLDPLDRLIVVSLSQHLWDFADPLNFAGYLLTSPLPGRSKKRVILQEGRYDDQVPNVATRGVVRAIGLPLLTPAVEPVYGLEQSDGPLDAAYVQWDTHPPVKPPGTNVPAPHPKPEESAHELVRRAESCMKQMEAFFKPDGQVVHTCNGPCDPE